jgi:hypothetical protein
MPRGSLIFCEVDDMIGFACRMDTRWRRYAMWLCLAITTTAMPACEWMASEPRPGRNAPPDPAPDPEEPPDEDPPPGNPSLTREPYLQMSSRTSVSIVFHTSEVVVPTVEFGTAPGALDRAASGPGARRHSIVLSGLAPGQRYWYRIVFGGQPRAGGNDYFFDTDAGRGDEEFSFFSTGDIGEPGGEQAVTSQRILQTAPRAELGLLCGDVIYPDGQASGYDPYLMRPWAGLMRNTNIWPALGNHDWHVDPDVHFAQEWVLPNNEHYYSFDRGNAHFIGLDTRDGDLYEGAAQVAWLRADLAAHRDAAWTFVYYHHPGITCTYKGYNDTVIDNFHPLFDEFGVDVVFMGHAHTYERMYPLRNGMPVHQDQEPNYRDPNGTIYVVSGCGAKLNSSTTSDCAVNAKAIDRTILFTHVTVRGATLTLRTIESATGTERDRMTITKTR